MADESAHLGQYALGELLGTGAMGSVYWGVGPTGQPVAVKVLHPHLTAQPEHVKRFQREAKLAEKLAPPHVVRVSDAGEDGGRHYLVMELVAGETLAARIERAGPLGGLASGQPPLHYSHLAQHGRLADDDLTGGQTRLSWPRAGCRSEVTPTMEDAG